MSWDDRHLSSGSLGSRLIEPYGNENVLSLAAAVWTICGIGVLLLVFSQTETWSLFPASIKQAAMWWHSFPNYCAPLAFLILITGAITLFVLRFEPVAYSLAMTGLTLALALSICSYLHAGFAFVGRGVVVQVPELWSKAVSTIVTPSDIRPGCTYRRTLPLLSYSITYNEHGKEHLVDIAYGVNPTNVREWLSIMVADGADRIVSNGCGNTYESPGVRCFTNASPARQRTTSSCLDYFGQHLKEEEKLRLRAIIDG